MYGDNLLVADSGNSRVLIGRAIAQGSSAAGVVSAFWRIWMPVGIVLIVSGLAALGLYVTYSRRLEKDNRDG